MGCVQAVLTDDRGVNISFCCFPAASGDPENQIPKAGSSDKQKKNKYT